MIFIGVDPGLTGSVAVLLEDGRVTFLDTPVLEVKVGKSLKKQMDAAMCSALLRGASQGPEDVLVTIEKVAPMPSFKVQREGEAPSTQSMGATSAFNFGMGFGIWQGICAALLLPYQLIHPATWKRNLMLAGGGKDAGRLKAIQLFPHAAKELARKKDHGRADALLLAAYGRKTYSKESFKPFKEEEQPELF